MCSIVGIIAKKPDSVSLREKLHKMLHSLVHRGPDENNIYLSKKVFLGNNRLSINHPDANNTQPSIFKDIIVVFNGEIYNYQELKDELISVHGVEFSTHCDTEVLPKLYFFYGKDFIKKVNGQFAIALYDKQTSKILLYRDRLGKKPLYYKKEINNIYFASETIGINAISPSSINFEEINNIVSYWSPVSSIYNDIKSVVEGTYIEIDIDTHEINVCEYWKLDEVLNQQKNYELDRCASEQIILDGLKTSIRLRLNTDVGFGVYLSGGLDSGIITHELSEMGKKFKTYSIGFKDSAEHNEMIFQKKLAEFYGVENIRLDISNDDIYNNFEQYIIKTESVLFRAAPIPMFLLAKTASSSGEKVIFSGEGSDELFFGYDIFREVKYSSLLRGKSKALQAEFIKKIYPYMLSEKHLKYLQMMLLSTKSDNLFSSHFLREKAIVNFNKFYKDRQDRLTIKTHLEQHLRNISSSLVRAQLIEYKTLLLNYLLSIQGDLPSMHGSIEVRAPFLDYRLIEMASAIPINNIFPTFKEKNILKNIYKHKLPSYILDRPKQPYRAPDSAIFYQKNEIIEKVDSFSEFGEFSRGMVTELAHKVVKQRDITYQDSLYFMVLFSTLLILNKKYESNPSHLIFNTIVDES